MIYNRWDVVVVEFPYIEGMDSKRRPALIISSDRLHKDHGLYWTAMITTAKAGVRPDDIAVTNRTQAGLPEDCVIRVPRMSAFLENQILRRLGAISTKDRNAVSALLRRYLP